MSDDLDFMPAEPKPAEPKPAISTALVDPNQRVDLPTWNRSRRKREANVRAGEQEDTFQRGVRMASRRAIDFPKLVIGGIVIATLAIAGAVVLNQKNHTATAEASRVLSTATVAIVRGQVVPAEDQVGLEDKIALSRFPVHATDAERQQAIGVAIDAALAVDGEAVAIDAQLVAAAHQVRIGEFEAAIAYYETFLAEADGDHPLRFMAIEGKGIAQEAQQDYEGALASFQQIAPNPSDFYRPMALYHQGRVLEALDRKDEAIAIYEQFFVEFPPDRSVLATTLVRERVEVLDPEFAARIATRPTLDTTGLGEFQQPGAPDLSESFTP